jgi:conjugative transfer region protein TrbK
MDAPLVFRLAAALFVISALAVSAVQALHPAPPTAPARQASTPTIARRDPLQREQQRCQALGEAGAQDQACLRVWAQTRARFLGAPDDREP